MLRSVPPRVLILLAGLLGAFLWSYWPSLSEMAEKWASDPQYSHAYLVPAFALVLLWLRRSRLDPAALAPSYWGAVLLLAGVGLRLFGTYYFLGWFEMLSILPVLAGAVLLLGGWTALRWSWPAVAFLFFMIPLPHTLETGMAAPLQSLATTVATYTLQTLGRPALAEGNIILINDARIGVVEACSGLGMLILFFALATAVALLSKRHLAVKLLIVASAAPIAVLANVTRITVTAFLHEMVGGKVADMVFHDLAGWLMMPLALAMLGVELWVLARLVIEVPMASAQLSPLKIPGRMPAPSAPRGPATKVLKR